MPKFSLDLATNTWTAKQYIRVTTDYTCECGNRMEIQIDWPEKVSMTSQITLNNLNCPQCHAPVVLPRAHYFVEGYRLLSKPIAEE